MQLQSILKKLNTSKGYLLFANVFLTLFLIIFANLGLLPVKNIADFSFFVFVSFAFALYRPGWSFLFFVGTIMLENINLAPPVAGIALRPYQFIGGLTALAVIVRILTKRLGFSLPRFSFFDSLIAVFAFSGFLSVLNATDKSLALKLSVISISFAVLYFLGRIFFQSLNDLKKVIPFFASSSMLVVIYSLWQNFRFIRGLNPFEVMPGRPNGTFTEPDWLGIFLVLLLAFFYALIFELRNTSPFTQNQKNQKCKLIYLHICLSLIFSAIIITVSRSAWLGSLAVTFIYLFIIWTDLKIKTSAWRWKLVFVSKLGILGSLLGSIFIIYFFGLTNFQLFNRAQSAGTGLQKITVSCRAKTSLPEAIASVSDLGQYGCRHINLEEIEAEKSAGNFVTETYRPDPNVNIRKNIYQKSWQEIKNSPVLGIGWGNIGRILGTDGRGAALNSSNIFLEIWLGSGLLGITAFVLMLIFVIINASKNFLKNNLGGKAFGLFLFLGFFALMVPNLFNAGVFLGILWLFFSISQIKSIQEVS